ncbi:MAG TPA: ATP-binding protein [Anaerolineales bacterium]|nr:ATP-binding protein [Anaerolineales bacterium]HLO34021.1 ATP-binding protein [Anaerolineales bacterium]
MPKPHLILLALEDSSILNLMDRVLRAVNYKTAIAKDTQSLGKILRESTPALVLIGEKFDGHDGLKVVKELQDQFPTLPFLVYVEKLSPELVKDIFRLGLSGYLSPPLKTDDIVNAVEISLKNAHRMGDWLRKEVNRTTSSLQKRAQTSEAEHARLEAVFNNIHDSVMILNQQNIITLVNPAMCRTFGINPKTAIGKPVLEVIKHPDLLTLITRADTKDFYQYHEINFPDGRVGNAHFIAIHEVGYAFTMQDITYLKEVDRIRSEFVHTVSHDLRSPLTSVIGYAELVERAGPLTEQQREFISRIQDSIQHITSLINDLLDLGSIEAGIDTRREFVQLEGILRYTTEMLRGQIKAKHLKIRTEIAPALPALRANPIRLRQVLDNVVGNAIKYSNINGEIYISIHSEGNQVIFQVTDQGPGIPPADQPHIFDKFYRGTNIGSDVEGSGLGLSIVKNIVENHQGRVWVESTVGKGSSFFIVLPVAAETLQIPKKKEMDQSSLES